MPSSKAAPRTVRKRSTSLANVRVTVAGGDTTTQIAHELRARQRAKLLDEVRIADGNFLVRVLPRDALVMKADLNIPWNKLRIIRRYQ